MIDTERNNSVLIVFLLFHVYCPVLLIITIQYIKGIIKYHDIQIQLFTKGHKSHKNQGIPKETNPHPAHMRSHPPIPPPHPSSPSHLIPHKHKHTQTYNGQTTW